MPERPECGRGSGGDVVPLVSSTRTPITNLGCRISPLSLMINPGLVVFSASLTASVIKQDDPKAKLPINCASQVSRIAQGMLYRSFDISTGASDLVKDRLSLMLVRFSNKLAYHKPSIPDELDLISVSRRASLAAAPTTTCNSC